jgi:hypothetical protein
MKAIAEITKDCLELPSSQRLKLARILLDVSESDLDYSPEVEAAWEDEIGARLAAVKNGTARSIPSAEVFADLDRRFPS